jgi:predicted Zn finger-like uncharacterized protein
MPTRWIVRASVFHRDYTMAFRIICPSCQAPNAIDDDKRGRKVRCLKCEEPISVPTAKKERQDEEAVQEDRKVRMKALNARKQTDDDEDQDGNDRPSKKKKAAKKGFPIVLLLGGGAALLLVLLLGAVGVAGFFYLRSRAADEPQVAQEEPKNETDKRDDKTNAKPDDKNKKPDDKLEPKKDPMPEDLSPELQRVKQATVQVLTRRRGGVTLEASGFFVSPGVIVTTAHALGMLEPNASPPNRLEVIVNGGEPTGIKVPDGYTIDRAADLAILRVDGSNLPAPLIFEDPSKLAPTQTVHVAGYPSGRTTRKDVTFNATEIADLKKDGTGTLEKIQLNGGTSPGSSGGPVVTPAGNVVGVALGALNEADIHLAIPATLVERTLAGKVGEGVFGKARPFGDKTIISYQVPLIDPLEKIKEARVEVWTGMPIPGRPYSYKRPEPLKGDGPRATQVLNKQGTFASGDITAPASTRAGQVAWVQPVIVLTDDSMQWGIAAVMPLPTSPYDRKPANLVANFQVPKERTVKLKCTFQGSQQKKPFVVTTDVDMLEIVTPDPQGGKMPTAYGAIDVNIEADGQNVTFPKQILDFTRQIPTSYTLDPTSKVRKRDPRQPGPDVPMGLRESVLSQQFAIGTAYEAALAPLPNRVVQPEETWQTSVPVMMRDKQKTAEVHLMLKNTYEGLLSKGNRSEAVITLTGKLQARDQVFKRFEGEVVGKIGFDVAGGYISSAELKLSTPDGSDKDFTYTLDIDLKRSAGNPLKIQLPQDPITIAKTKTVLDTKEKLAASDPFDPTLSQPKKKAHMKAFTVKMEAGKTYVIDLKSTAFDAFLRLSAPTGMPLASDDNGGGGTNARITYRANATGMYRILAISHNGKIGAFHLTVTENP